MKIPNYPCAIVLLSVMLLAPSAWSTPPPQSSTPSPSTTRTFIHPGIFSTKKQLDFVKQKIQNKEQPWLKAFHVLKSTNPLARTIQAHVTVPGNPKKRDHRGLDNFVKDGEYAYAAALLWYFTDESKYAHYAINALNAWSILRYPTHKLWMSWGAPHFLNAAEIIKHTPGSGWRKEDMNAFNEMVEKFMWPAIQPPKVNRFVNHRATANEAQFAVAIFLDDHAKFNQALEFWKYHTKNYVHLNKPKRYDGEHNETCRDLNHMKLGARGMMYAAEYAWNQGHDLWKLEQNRLAAFGEFQAGIMTGLTPVPKDICAWKDNKHHKSKPGVVFCKGNVSWADPEGHAPCNETAWDMLYNHMHGRLQHPMPMTRKMSERNRPLGGITRRNLKWETLLKYGVPTH